MNQRKRFEATLGNRLPTGRSRANKDEYEYVPTHFAWLAWQEAERQMIERCAERIDSMPRYPDQYECAEAIRAMENER